MTWTALTPGIFSAAVGVDALDLGVGIRAAQDEGVQHAGAVDVEAVLGLAGGLVGAVEARDLGADQAAFFGQAVAMVQPPFLSPWHSAAMASRICS